MNTSFVKSAIFAIGTVLALSSGVTAAQEGESAMSLKQLLGFVKQGEATEAKENRAREAPHLRKEGVGGGAKAGTDLSASHLRHPRPSTPPAASLRINGRFAAGGDLVPH